MKKALILILTAVAAAALTACSAPSNTQNTGSGTLPSAATDSQESLSESENTQPAETPSDSGNSSLSEESPLENTTPPEEALPTQSDSQSDGNGILVAYFSWANNALIDGPVDAVTSPSVTAPGHVSQLASWIQEETGGDLFSIQVTDPYPSDWDQCLARANEERSQNARPQLTGSVENMDAYDVVFLGYPNWWYGAPMALLSFIEENDLADKQIYLFCSHGTGGLAGSVEDIAQVLPESTVLSENVFDVYEEDAYASQELIQSCLDELGY